MNDIVEQMWERIKATEKELDRRKADEADIIPWTDYSSTSTVTGWSSTTTKVIRYMRTDKLAIVTGNIFGTSDNTATNITLPYTSANNGLSHGVMVRVQDNGVWLDGYMELVANSSLLRFYTSSGGGPWTASGTKRVYFVLPYEIT